MKLETLMEYDAEIEDSNSAALTAMNHISSDKSTRYSCLYQRVLTSLLDFGKLYETLSKNLPSYVSNTQFADVLYEVAKRDVPLVTRLDEMRRFDATKCPSFQTTLDELVLQVSEIRPEFEGERAQQQRITGVQSVQEYIRWIHENINTIYMSLIQNHPSLLVEKEFNKSKSNAIEFEYHNAEIKIIDLDWLARQKESSSKSTTSNNSVSKNTEGVEPSKEGYCVHYVPLQVLQEFYQHPNIEDKQGSETYKVILQGDTMKAKMSLGCHSADMNTTFNDDSQLIVVRYTDSTGYKSSKERASIVTSIFTRMGFTVKEKGIRVEASVEYQDIEKAKKSLHDVYRLIAGIKNIDLLDHEHTVKGRDTIINAFFRGDICLYKQ